MKQYNLHTKHFYSIGTTIDVGEPKSNSRSEWMGFSINYNELIVLVIDATSNKTHTFCTCMLQLT